MPLAASSNVTRATALLTRLVAFAAVASVLVGCPDERDDDAPAAASRENQQSGAGDDSIPRDRLGEGRATERPAAEDLRTLDELGGARGKGGEAGGQ